MAKSKDPVETIRQIALRYPEVEEADSCNKTAFRAGKKNFLFLGVTDESWDAKLKLSDSLDEVAGLAKKDPERYGCGSSGWTDITFPRNEAPPAGTFERWIDESYRLLVPKKLVAALPENGPPSA